MSRTGCSAFSNADWRALGAGVFRFVGRRNLPVALLCAALLQGCGGAPWEEAREAAEDTARTLAALKPASPRFTAIRLIERRPWLGLVRQEGEARAALPARFLEPDAVTLPLSGIGGGSVLARRIEAATGLGVRFTGAAPASEGRAATEGFAAAGIDGLVPDGGVWTGPLDALLDAWTGHGRLCLALRRGRDRDRPQ